MLDVPVLFTEVDTAYLWRRWALAVDEMHLADNKESAIQAGRWYRALMAGYAMRDNNPFYNKIWILGTISALAEMDSKTSLTPADRSSVTMALWFSHFSYDSSVDLKQNRLRAAKTFMEFMSTNAPNTTKPTENAFRARVMRALTGKEPVLYTNEADYTYRIFLDCTLAYMALKPSQYRSWIARLRKQQEVVPEALWIAQRLKKLKEAKELPVLYRTATARTLFEDQARKNIATEIEDLEMDLKILEHTTKTGGLIG